MSLQIDKKQNASEVTIFAAGRLDTSTAPELDKVVEESIQSAQELVMDLKDLEYISSAGLRVLLKAQKVMRDKGGMKVIHANEIVMEVFEVTGFTDILTIE